MKRRMFALRGFVPLLLSSGVLFACASNVESVTTADTPTPAHKNLFFASAFGDGTKLLTNIATAEFCCDPADKEHCWSCEDFILPAERKAALMPQEPWAIQEIAEGSKPIPLVVEDVLAAGGAASGIFALYWQSTAPPGWKPSAELQGAYGVNANFLCYPESLAKQGLEFKLLFNGIPYCGPFCEDVPEDSLVPRRATAHVETKQLDGFSFRCHAVADSDVGGDVLLQVSKAGETIPFLTWKHEHEDKFLASCVALGCGSISQFEVWWITSPNGQHRILSRSEHSSLYLLNEDTMRFEAELL